MAERQADWEAAQRAEEKQGEVLQDQFDQDNYDFAAGIDPEEERGPYWGRQDAPEASPQVEMQQMRVDLDADPDTAGTLPRSRRATGTSAWRGGPTWATCRSRCRGAPCPV